MKQKYFILVLAHSLHGRLQRIHIPHTVVYGILALAVVGCLTLFGFVSSYVRMAWKVANYNALKGEAEAMRLRYDKLQKVVSQTNEQLASLQLLAREFSAAYGIKRKLEGPPDLSAEARLVPSFSETVMEYNYLRSSSGPRLDRSYARRWHLNVLPSIWPVVGRLIGPYGQRIDPFSGEGAYHTGVDIAAPTGTVVRASADGVAVHAGRNTGYGLLVGIDHGNGIETYYAHLSRIFIIVGQEIRRGEPLGAVGSSGRVTAPHLHYEVRVSDVPVNPYRYLVKPPITQVAAREFVF